MTRRPAPRSVGKRVGRKVAHRLRHSPRLALALAIAATGILYAVPQGQWLVYPLMLLSTLAHEMGHGVAAILIGGRFHRFEMWPDGSGVAFWSAGGGGEIGRLELAFVAAGGLVGPAMVAALLLVAARRPRGARRGLVVLAVALGLALLLVVRGLFGMLFVTVLAAGLYAVARASGDELARLVLVFLAVQLALSVFSRGDYLFTPTAETGAGPMPSDVGQMADALFLPYWFWGALCGLVSLSVVVASLLLYWGRDD